MLYYGNIELVSGEILNCIVENLAQDPEFVRADSGRVYFNTTTGTLKYNNGIEYVDTAGGFNAPLVDTLGSNWINNDYSFNPEAFSNFSTVTNLSANSTLFTVLSDMDAAIGNFQLGSIFDIANVKETSTLQTGDICFFNGVDFTFASINNLINEYSAISTETLSDIEIVGNLESGNVFVWSSLLSKFVNTPIFYNYTNYSSAVSFTVTHNLGVLYPFVNVVNPGNNQTITPTSVIYIDENQLIVNISSPSPVVINVIGVPLN
jgi:hypothetical protein